LVTSKRVSEVGASASATGGVYVVEKLFTRQRKILQSCVSSFVVESNPFIARVSASCRIFIAPISFARSRARTVRSARDTSVLSAMLDAAGMPARVERRSES
jgi:hypothetical protein